jgi:glycosyltransferase involved in cell wall biosynthesis
MRIAILTAGVLPVPAVQGGAVENLIDFCLEFNDKYHLHDITVYSISHPAVKNHTALKSKNNHYRFINTNNWIARIKKKIYLRQYGGEEYYHYSVEYFFHEACKHISKQNYDIIIIENRPAFALKLHGKTNAKLVLHQENDYLNSNLQAHSEIYQKYSCIINTSSYVTQRVRTIDPNDSKCHTVLNGIDTQRFYNATAISRHIIGLNEKQFVIVFSGRLTKDKGILELILAIKKLSNTVNCKLLIIGASAYGKDKEPTRFIRKLEEETKAIHESVFYTGYVDYKDIPSYLKVADIAVVPSMWEEPFGLTVVEAMAAGLPLITTRSGGIPEICEGVATIVERDNIVDNLAAAILDLYQHPEKRKQMSAASLERSKLFDKETYAKNFFAALEGLEGVYE